MGTFGPNAWSWEPTWNVPDTQVVLTRGGSLGPCVEGRPPGSTVGGGGVCVCKTLRSQWTATKPRAGKQHHQLCVSKPSPAGCILKQGLGRLWGGSQGPRGVSEVLTCAGSSLCLYKEQETEILNNL